MIWSGLGMSKRYCTRSRQQLSSSPWILPLPKPFILGVSEMPFAGFDRCRIVVNWISLWRPQLPREKTPPKHVTSYSFGYFKYRFFQEDHRKKTEKDFSALPFLDLAPSKDMPVVQWKKPGCLGFVKGIILPSYPETMKKHEKDPYSTTRSQWKEMPVVPPQNPLKNGKNRGPKHPGLPLGPRILRVNQIWSLTLWDSSNWGCPLTSERPVKRPGWRSWKKRASKIRYR